MDKTRVRLAALCAAAAGLCAAMAAEPLPKNAGFETPNAKGGGAASIHYLC